MTQPHEPLARLQPVLLAKAVLLRLVNTRPLSDLSERLSYLAQAAIAGDQGLLQRGLGCFGTPAAVQVPAQQFTAVAVDARPSDAQPSRPVHTRGTGPWPSVHQEPWSPMAKPGSEA